MRILDPNGAFASTRLPDLQVPPGAVVVRDVSAILENQPIAIGSSAPGSVTEALRQPTAGDPRDFAVAGVSQALTAPAVVPAVKRVRARAVVRDRLSGAPAGRDPRVHRAGLNRGGHHRDDEGCRDDDLAAGRTSGQPATSC